MNLLKDLTHLGAHDKNKDKANHDENWLITVERAEGVEDKDRWSKADTYAIIEFGDQKVRTHTINNSRTPFWNETFNLKIRPDHIKDFHVRLMDDDFGPDDPIGTAVISRQDLPFQSGDERYLRIPLFRKEQTTGIIVLRVKKFDNIDNTTLTTSQQQPLSTSHEQLSNSQQPPLPPSYQSHDVTTSHQPRDVTTSHQPRDVTTSYQPHDVTTSYQPHDVTTSHQSHNVATSRQPDVITSHQPHDVTTSHQPHNVTYQSHVITSDQPYGMTASHQPHNITTSHQPHDITITRQSHDMTTSHQPHGVTQERQEITSMTYENQPSSNAPIPQQPISSHQQQPYMSGTHANYQDQYQKRL